MTNVVAYSDFTGDLRLDLNAGNQAKFTLYIPILQEEIIKMLLGQNLYAEMDVTPAPAKWTELVTAQTTYYTYSGYKFKYPGLKRLIACYIYFKWSTLEFSSSTPEGETISESTNGTSIINNAKISRIWNDLVRLYNEVALYIEYKNSVTSDYYYGFEPQEINIINAYGI